jgi:hypothetical protein
MRAVLIAGMLSMGAAATDLTGIWLGQIRVRNGEFRDIAFRFTQSGSTLEGKLYGDASSAKIAAGRVAGDLVTFTVVVTEQAGTQINETRFRYTGKFQGGEIELLREREESRNAGNGAGVEIKQSPKQTVRLKKLL